jgi:hypothetical protein
MPEENPESSSLERRRLQTILHKLVSLLNDSAEIKSAIDIQVGIAWIRSGEGLYREQDEKLHVEGILRITNTWTRSEELSGFSLYFNDDPDGPYAIIYINKMDISIRLDIDQNVISQG